MISVWQNQKPVIICLILCLATILSWEMGLGFFESLSPTFVAISNLVIAFAKVSLILLYFMGLANAPLHWKLIFLGWAISVCALLSWLVM